MIARQRQERQERERGECKTFVLDTLKRQTQRERAAEKQRNSVIVSAERKRGERERERMRCEVKGAATQVYRCSAMFLSGVAD